ncbi:hypothetical protein B0H13DRAFT_2305338 [Mycena leptocephala]|nr:hypothetical protein B0H13DRAFT_2305338 [Mycena leptocephala]
MFRASKPRLGLEISEAQAPAPAPSPWEPSGKLAEPNHYERLLRDAGFGALVPTFRNKNPHRPDTGFAPSGPDDHAGVPFQKHYGGGAGLVMSHNTAMTNVLPRVVDLIASDPEVFVIFVPFLGGAHFNKFCSASPDITKFLEAITGPGGIDIYPPTAAEKEDFACHPLYHPPWVLIGKCISKAVRDEITRHQLIAFTPDLATHILKVDFLRMSWLLGHWRCNTIAPVNPSVMRATVALHALLQGPIRTGLRLQ